MSNITNLSRQIAKLSAQLTDAKAKGDIDLAEQLEDEINDLEDQLEEEEEANREARFGWS